METAKKVTKQLYNHSFVRYVAIGGTTFALDFFLLVLMHGALNINLVLSTSVAYWVSIAFNFVTNRFWTFGATETHVAKHLTAYLLLLGFNYLFTVAFIGIAAGMGMHYTIAKILSVGIQVTWTYYAYKRIVFR